MGKRSAGSKMSLAQREKIFAEKVKAIGRYEYLSGFSSYSESIIVRHLACGNEVMMTGNAMFHTPKTDTCSACRIKGEPGESAMQRYCRRESKDIIETLVSEGYLFDDELVEYITYCARDFSRVKENVYDVEECIDMSLENVYNYYNANHIGLCRCCQQVKRGLTEKGWGKKREYFLKRICKDCYKKIN